MPNILLAVLFLLLALAGVVIRKTYYYVPVLELKRQAERKQHLAVVLYRAVAYGNSLRALLWLYIGFTSAVSLILLAKELPIWAGLLIVGPLLWVTFSLVPATRLTSFGARLTMLVTPAIAWLLNYAHPLFSRGAEAVDKRIMPAHTNVYERDDLLHLIEKQQAQPDNRISPEALEIVRRALQFDDHIVGDILITRKKVSSVLASDTLGPILIDELHKSGQSLAVVRDTKKGPIVGSLRIEQLGIQSKGKVADVMDGTVYYLHESDSLGEALHAFFATNHPLFVVVNSFEEYVGVITIESVLKQLLGHIPGDHFDQYTDLAAVAGRHPQVETAETTSDAPIKTDEEVLEYPSDEDSK